MGSSGAGKTTLARLVAGLLTPDTGAVAFEGTDLATLHRAERRAARRRLHLVFRNPYTALAGHLRVAFLVAEPLVIHRVGSRAHRAALVPEALVLRPRLIVADEPTAMLGPRVRAGLLSLLAEPQAASGMAYLFITHDALVEAAGRVQAAVRT